MATSTPQAELELLRTQADTLGIGLNTLQDPFALEKRLEQAEDFYTQQNNASKVAEVQKFAAAMQDPDKFKGLVGVFEDEKSVAKQEKKEEQEEKDQEKKDNKERSQKQQQKKHAWDEFAKQQDPIMAALAWFDLSAKSAGKVIMKAMNALNDVKAGKKTIGQVLGEGLIGPLPRAAGRGVKKLVNAARGKKPGTNKWNQIQRRANPNAPQPPAPHAPAPAPSATPTGAAPTGPGITPGSPFVSAGTLAGIQQQYPNARAFSRMDPHFGEVHGVDLDPSNPTADNAVVFIPKAGGVACAPGAANVAQQVYAASPQLQQAMQQQVQPGLQAQFQSDYKGAGFDVMSPHRAPPSSPMAGAASGIVPTPGGPAPTPGPAVPVTPGI